VGWGACSPIWSGNARRFTEQAAAWPLVWENSRLKPVSSPNDQRLWFRERCDEGEKKVTVGAATSFARSASARSEAGATLAAPLVATAQADSETNDEKRHGTLQAPSREGIYRVNRYPT